MKKFAAFDIDGTLIRWQLYHAVVDRLAELKLLGPDAEAAIKAARMRWKKREHPEAFRTYEKELISIYEGALVNLDTAQFDAAVQDIAHEYTEQVYTFTRKLVGDLKAKGYILLAISGSQEELVEQVAKLYGFDDWVGTRYERQDQRFTGKSFIASFDKKAILNDMIQKHQLSLAASLAVGDSGSDIAMLEMVEQPIAFNPDQTLFAEAKKRHWNIVVERKNVVYHLEALDDQYLLA